MENENEVYELIGRMQFRLFQQDKMITQLNTMLEDIRMKNQELNNKLIENAKVSNP